MPNSPFTMGSIHSVLVIVWGALVSGSNFFQSLLLLILVLQFRRSLLIIAMLNENKFTANN